MTSRDILKKLIDGNERYIEGTPRQGITAESRKKLVKGQHPHAVIVGCSDSRVPVELIFDAWPGELFIVRTAGNVVGPLEIGSVEFAIKEFGTSLVVVLGHQNCGAVNAAQYGGEFSPSIQAIIGEIPSGEIDIHSDDPHGKYEDENIRYTLSKIAGNPHISEAISEKKVFIIGAKYSLETGKVSFFE